MPAAMSIRQRHTVSCNNESLPQIQFLRIMCTHALKISKYTAHQATLHPPNW